MIRTISLAVLSGALLWGGGAAEASKSKTTKVVTGQVNLNQATAEQLSLLPGVGEKTAKAIIAYRQKSKFARIEDLVRVKGFGKKKFDKLKANLTVTGPTNATVRTVPVEATARARSAPPR